MTCLHHTHTHIYIYIYIYMGNLGVLSAVPPPPSGIKQLAELSAVSVLSVVSKHNYILEIHSGNTFWTYILEIHYGDTFWNINMFISCLFKHLPTSCNVGDSHGWWGWWGTHTEDGGDGGDSHRWDLHRRLGLCQASPASKVEVPAS